MLLVKSSLQSENIISKSELEELKEERERLSSLLEELKSEKMQAERDLASERALKPSSSVLDVSMETEKENEKEELASKVIYLLILLMFKLREALSKHLEISEERDQSVHKFNQVVDERDELAEKYSSIQIEFQKLREVEIYVLFNE